LSPRCYVRVSNGFLGHTPRSQAVFDMEEGRGNAARFSYMPPFVGFRVTKLSLDHAWRGFYRNLYSVKIIVMPRVATKSGYQHPTSRRKDRGRLVTPLTKSCDGTNLIVSHDDK